MMLGLARSTVASCVALACALLPCAASAYPLDGFAETGIRRLEGLRLANDGKIADVKQPRGALLPLAAVDLRLAGATMDLPPVAPVLNRRLAGILAGNLDGYGVAVLDLTDPAKPRYAEHNGGHRQNVGSVGKVVVALALFQALADAYPNDLQARQRVLKTTTVTADGFSQYDHHTVRMFNVETRSLVRRAIQVGDRASLWEFIDWMMSPSSNSAAGMVMREAMLLRQYGTAYPVPEREIQRFFAQTPKSELTALYEKTFFDPITRNGLDLAQLRQGSFFTATGKKIVPGGGDSYGTARELMRYLLKMEQGALVDTWSSREIKRLMYVTERRIRYASAPALADAAVYFKSGSLYECTKEPGFACGQYMGNVKNYMNSIAIVEYPAGDRKLYYMVTLISNVLRKNSAAEHQALAGRLHQMIDQAQAR